MNVSCYRIRGNLTVGLENVGGRGVQSRLDQSRWTVGFEFLGYRVSKTVSCYRMSGNLTGGLEKVGGMSPVTLSEDWSRVARLLVVVCLSVVGSVGNVYMVSAIMIEDHLKKRGWFQFKQLRSHVLKI